MRTVLLGFTIGCALIGLAGLVTFIIERRQQNGHRRDAEDYSVHPVAGAGSPADQGATSGEGPGTSTSGADEGTGEGPGLEDVEQTYIAPVWGFRGWVLGDGPIPQLHSYRSRSTWVPGKNTALCDSYHDPYSRTSTLGCSTVPGAQCSCGMYAVRDPVAVPQPRDLFTVVGGAVGWGRIIDGKHGWRAEHAAVAALYCPPWTNIETRMRLDALAELFDVPLCSTLAELAKATEDLAKWMAGEDLIEGGDDAVSDGDVGSTRVDDDELRGGTSGLR